MSIEKNTQNVRESSLGWMIQRIAGRLDKAMEQRLSVHDLTLQQFAVMMTALEHDGLTQTGIGGHFGMPAYAISRAIDHLEAKDLLDRKAHPTSRRSYTIHATDKGRELSSALFTIVGEVNEEFTSPLSAGQRAEFKNLLEKLL